MVDSDEIYKWALHISLELCGSIEKYPNMIPLYPDSYPDLSHVAEVCRKIRAVIVGLHLLGTASDEGMPRNRCQEFLSVSELSEESMMGKGQFRDSDSSAILRCNNRFLSRRILYLPSLPPSTTFDLYLVPLLLSLHVVPL